MASQYQNTPGIELFTLDGQLVARADRPQTESLLIIGPALDGPTDKPLSISGLGDVELTFGPIAFNSQYRGPNNESQGFSGNALIKALREAQYGGAQDVRLMRVGGKAASGVMTMPSVLNAGVSGTVLFYARNNGRIYNDVRVDFASGATSGAVTVTQPVSKGGSFTIKWAFATSGSTILDVIDRINSDPRNRTVKAAAGTAGSTAAARLLNGGCQLAGASDGTVWDELASSKKPLYDALTDSVNGTFVLLEDYEVDVVLLAGIYIDDAVDGNAGATTPSLSASQVLANWLGKRTLDYPIIGVIGTRPLDEFNNKLRVNDHYLALANQAAGTRDTGWLYAGYFLAAGFAYSDSNLEQAIDAGGYLQTVAADAIFNDPDLGAYTESLAAVYAGSICATPPHEAMTHKPVKGVFGLAFEFSRTQIDYLVGGIGRDQSVGIDGGGGYVCAKRFGDRGILWVRDCTSANRKSDFKDLQVLRIANAVHKAVKSIAFPFLGRPNSLEIRQSLLTQVKRYLDSLYEAGALLGKDQVGYQVNLTGGDDAFSQLMGVLTLDITLRPALQIKKIRVRVRMSL